MNQSEWANDPDFIAWLEDRLQEAREAQDAEMEAKHQAKRDFWLNETQHTEPF